MERKEIGSILKKLREKSGKTQKEVAELLGRKQQVVGHWETGYAQPDANTLFLLCKIYDADLDEAFGFKPKNQASYAYSNLSFGALELARAYDKADLKSKNIARQALDLPVLQSDPPANEASEMIDRRSAV